MTRGTTRGRSEKYSDASVISEHRRRAMCCTAVRTVGRKMLWAMRGFAAMPSATPVIFHPIWRQVQRCISFLRALIRWPDWPPALVLMGFSQCIVMSDKWPSCDGWAFCLLCELLPGSILSLRTLIQEVAARVSRCSSVTLFPWWHDANALATFGTLRFEHVCCIACLRLHRSAGV